MDLTGSDYPIRSLTTPDTLVYMAVYQKPFISYFLSSRSFIWYIYQDQMNGWDDRKEGMNGCGATLVFRVRIRAFPLSIRPPTTNPLHSFPIRILLLATRIRPPHKQQQQPLRPWLWPPPSSSRSRYPAVAVPRRPRRRREPRPPFHRLSAAVRWGSFRSSAAWGVLQSP